MLRRSSSGEVFKSMKSLTMSLTWTFSRWKFPEKSTSGIKHNLTAKLNLDFGFQLEAGAHACDSPNKLQISVDKCSSEQFAATLPRCHRLHSQRNLGWIDTSINYKWLLMREQKKPAFRGILPRCGKCCGVVYTEMSSAETAKKFFPFCAEWAKCSRPPVTCNSKLQP